MGHCLMYCMLDRLSWFERVFLLKKKIKVAKLAKSQKYGHQLGMRL